jgi:hypothetical protein
MERFRLFLLPALGLLAAYACGSPGQMHDDTGLVGVAVREGSLAGTWGHSVEFSSVVPVPLLGDRPGGGRSTRLVHRTWDPAEKRYHEVFVRCTNDVFEVERTRTIVREETLQLIAPVHHASTALHPEGLYQSEDVIDLWGVRDLPDPAQTPLPTQDDYLTPPQSDWIWDEDEDGKPGVTVYMRGLLNAELHVCKRNIYTFDGAILGPDRIQGLVRETRAESNSITADPAWLAGEGGSTPDPNPLNSWFDMVRLKDGATCDDVARAVAEGRLAVTRPFAND